MKRYVHALCFVAASLGLILAEALSAQPLKSPPAPSPADPPSASMSEVIATPAKEEANYSVTGIFTAQRRPRVTVLGFDDNNTEAKSASYSSSVEAMLVTFLKRKSQFVVVERQKLGGLLEERQRIGKGMVQVEPGNEAAHELLEKLDAYILGSVTLLNISAEVDTAETQSQPQKGDQPDSGETKKRQRISGPRIEVDAKLLARFDARIIAAAQRSGPVACLRSIVERLGIALEQEFLRPYYGKLTFKLADPESVRIFLTPILLDNALDEEKPPVERSSTVKIGSGQDGVEPWTTDPAAYTIENLLSGWYSLRLERPGYDKLPVNVASWEARKTFDEIQIYERRDNLLLDDVDPEKRRYVVRVDPLRTETIDGDDRGFVFRKKGGAVQPRIKRQYLDSDFSRPPARAILLGGADLEINQVGKIDEYADDTDCDLFSEKPPTLPDYGRTYIASGQAFEFDTFKGGQLIIEDYKGEAVPAGRYSLTFWEPYYETSDTEVSVRDRDLEKSSRVSLVRQSLPLEIRVTGSQSSSRALFEGRDTHAKIETALDFDGTKVQPSLPVDSYSVATNIPGLDGWRTQVDLLPTAPSPPEIDTRSDPKKATVLPPDPAKSTDAGYQLTVKTRLSIAGRLENLSQPPNPQAADLNVDRTTLKILNLLLYGQEERPQAAESKSFRDKAGKVIKEGRDVLRGINVPTPPLASPTAVPIDWNKAPETTTPAASVTARPPSPPKHDASPDIEALIRLLSKNLEVLDLLILDSRDVVALRKSPEAAAAIDRWVRGGGAIFAFISEAGDYSKVFGAPLAIKALGKLTDRFELAPGSVNGILPILEKKVKVKSKRALPELAKLTPGDGWRVVAYTKSQKAPRIIERGERDKGGYIAVWLDDPTSFQGRKGGTVVQVERTRANLEERVVEWARYLMYRRFDKAGDQKRRAEEALLH